LVDSLNSKNEDVQTSIKSIIPVYRFASSDIKSIDICAKQQEFMQSGKSLPYQEAVGVAW
jgi:hypothetical protein